MSIWEEQHVHAAVVDVLAAVPVKDEPHPFGRPFITAYQLAVRVELAHPEIREALDYADVGGRGAGSYNTLAQYLPQQLSRLIKAAAITDIEGSFLSNEGLIDLEFADFDGTPRHSSLTDTQYDLSLFRLR